METILALFRAIPSGDEIATAKTISRDSPTSLGLTSAVFRQMPSGEEELKELQSKKVTTLAWQFFNFVTF
jgi:hypothetical protein